MGKDFGGWNITNGRRKEQYDGNLFLDLLSQFSSNSKSLFLRPLPHLLIVALDHLLTFPDT